MTQTRPEDPAENRGMEPPVTDTSWLRMEPHNARPSGWLRQAPTGPHWCAPPSPGPQTAEGRPTPRSAADRDVWRCTCGMLWMVEHRGDMAWWVRAPLPLRLLHWMGWWPGPGRLTWAERP